MKKVVNGNEVESFGTYEKINRTEKFSTDIQLVGRLYLKVNRVRSTVSSVSEIDSFSGKSLKNTQKYEEKEIVSTARYDLKEITVETLRQLRKTKIPSFVLKETDEDGIVHYWYAKIEFELSFLSSDLIGEHQCSYGPDCCARVSAASDEEGGCSKVRHKARYIELYPWIPFGYETFNTKSNTLMVAKCDHYTPAVRKPKPSRHSILQMKMNIAEYVYDDPNALYKMRKEREKNERF